MQLSHNTVLVTGGGSGIGLAIAKYFLDAGSQVIICGRRADKLAEAGAMHPGLETRVADIADATGREELIAWMIAKHPDFNLLVNNAGIQRRERFATDTAQWSSRQQEIAINLEAPIHLASLVLEHFRAQPQAAIINISSGLAFVPALFAPVYAATKAALHSFTMSLRAELDDTSIQVVEIIPPAVNTDLGGTGIHTSGVPVDEFVNSVMARVAAGELEVGYGSSEAARRASREQLDDRFAEFVASMK
ncbi:SDR family NAD(P)-dependent oxidoreductase [Calothrix sp. FACHB-156]|nr:SDR family NAD(P)-dependent oxidoreductase [Calothrix membranacea FACHB-236]MBD2342407.1 SDR family NAD(P)-dependent oxidoreductase [Calothrix sp. FACHB-156]